MAMKKRMSFDKAVEVAAEIAAGRAKYGIQFSPPHSTNDLMDAITIIHARLMQSVPVEEHDLLKKQLQAANARAAKANNKGG